MARSTKNEAAKTAKETAQEASKENLEKESQENKEKEGQENQAPEDDTKVAADTTPRFTKEQLLKSNWYSHRRDLLGALLKDGEMYSHAGVANLISEFMKGKVR